MNILYIFIGGGLGSLLRYGLSVGIGKTNLQLPLATLLANALACFIFGATVQLFSDKLNASPQLKLLLLTGVCGGLSTFSTFSYETVLLFKQQAFAWAIFNILVNTILCLSIFYYFTKSST